MSLAMLQQNAHLLLERRNLITMGVGLLISAALTLFVTLPAFHEVERLKGLLPVSRQKLGQTRELGTLVAQLETKRRDLREFLPSSGSGEGEPEEGEDTLPVAETVSNPVVILLKVAHRHRVDPGEPRLSVPEEASRAETMELRLDLRGELTSLQGAAGDIFRLPFVEKARQLGLRRDREEFVLDMVLAISGE